MSAAQKFEAAGYRYAPGVFQYSAGVAAEPGHEIIHVRLSKPVPLVAGFTAIAAYLTSAGRPLTSFCACELRSPEPFSEAGFRAFNETYVGTLSEWGIFKDGINPVARSNVCPKLAPPPEPSFYAFAYTVESAEAPPTCIVAGSGEVPEGRDNYRDHVVAAGDTSPRGMRQKAAYVTAEMNRRLATLSMQADAVTTAQAYTLQPVHPLWEAELSASGLTDHGLLWHYASPPIVGLEFEMDVRVIRHELTIWL